jgi:hypothetical protein
MPLPPRAPQLNPQENIWQFMRQNWLTNRIFKSFRRHRRSLLLCLEHPHRLALENHVHRSPRLGKRRSIIVRIGITLQHEGEAGEACSAYGTQLLLRGVAYAVSDSVIPPLAK